MTTEYDVHVFPMVNNGLGWKRGIEEDYWQSFGPDRDAALDFAQSKGKEHDQALVHWTQYRGDELVGHGEEAEYGPGTANTVTAHA